MTKLEMTKQEFLDILKFYIENVQVKFNSRIYKLSADAQTSPLFANMVMDWCKEKIVKGIQSDLKLYKRFADDILLVISKNYVNIGNVIEEEFSRLIDTVHLVLEWEDEKQM